MVMASNFLAKLEPEPDDERMAILNPDNPCNPQFDLEIMRTLQFLKKAVVK
jgi:hypothetical protein